MRKSKMTREIRQRAKDPRNKPKSVVRRTSNERGDLGDHIWEKQKGETDFEFQVFTFFLETPAHSRTVAAAWQKLKYLDLPGVTIPMRSMRNIRNLFKKHRWAERAAAKDRHDLANAHNHAVDLLAQEYFAQGKVGTMIYARAAAALQRKDQGWWDKLGAKDLAKLVEVGSKVTTEAKEKLVDLSAARIDAADPDEAREFVPGSRQEAIFEAILRDDWAAVQELSEELAVLQNHRRAAMPSRANPLDEHQKEKVRSLLQVITKATFGGNGPSGNGGGQGGSTPPPTNGTPSNGSNGSPQSPIDCKPSGNHLPPSGVIQTHENSRPKDHSPDPLTPPSESPDPILEVHEAEIVEPGAPKTLASRVPNDTIDFYLDFDDGF